MPGEPAEKQWTRRFRLIGTAAASLTAVVGVATAIFTSYSSLQEAKQSKEDAKVSYEALVSKVNALAEHLAYLEGRLGSPVILQRAHRVGETPPPPPAPPEAPAGPEVTVTELMMATDGDGLPDLPVKKFKVGAYQQLPTSLDALTDTQQAYKE